MRVRLVLAAMFSMSLSTGATNAQNVHNIIGGLINSAMQANNQSAPNRSQATNNQSYCDGLWFERNKIFYGAGYCFKSGPAIAVFGGQCNGEFRRLAPAAEARVSAIKSLEVSAGCPPSPRESSLAALRTQLVSSTGSVASGAIPPAQNQSSMVADNHEQATGEAARVAREAKEAQEKAKREDDERRLAIARAEAEKAKAEREKALALAQVEIEKAKAAAQVEAEKAKAKAAAEAAQAKAEIDQRRAQAEAEKAKIEAESARFAKEEEEGKNSWSGKLSSLFGENQQRQQKIAAETEKKRVAAELTAKSNLQICSAALDSERRAWDDPNIAYPSPVAESALRGLTVDACQELVAAEAERVKARVAAEAQERSIAEQKEKITEIESALRRGSFVIDGKLAKVSGVGLGEDWSCNGASVEPTEVGNSIEGVTGIMTLCNINESKWDKTTVYVDSKRSRVVSVQRNLYIGQNTSLNDLLDSAEKFFGKPELNYRGMSNTIFIGYGNAFSVRRLTDKDISVERLPSGRGLSIQVWWCFNLGTRCPTGAYYLITFHLVDGAEYERAIEEGRRALEESRKRRGSSQKF